MRSGLVWQRCAPVRLPDEVPVALSSQSRSEIGGGATYSAVKRADEWEMAREKTAARRNKNIAPTHMLDCFVGWIAAFYGELHECSFDVDGSGGAATGSTGRAHIGLRGLSVRFRLE